MNIGTQSHKGMREHHMPFVYLQAQQAELNGLSAYQAYLLMQHMVNTMCICVTVQLTEQCVLLTMR